MKVALLISTYNWKEALNLVLQSVERQTLLPDEVLIADDGSREDTKELIDVFKNNKILQIKHIWHEDEGFRRSKILNKTISASDADYIIQVDGDCILSPRFIEDHVAHAKEGLYLYGARVNVRKEYVDEVFKKQLIDFNFFSKEIKNKTRTIYSKFLAGLYGKHEKIGKMRGCNLSFWRKDFIAINGYNEDMEGWGMEDSEMVMRLHNNGLWTKRLRYIGAVYHIYHRVASKDRVEQNMQIQALANDPSYKWCKNGVDKYLSQK